MVGRTSESFLLAHLDVSDVGSARCDHVHAVAARDILVGPSASKKIDAILGFAVVIVNPRRLGFIQRQRKGVQSWASRN
jgi:hypothetical protein